MSVLDIEDAPMYWIHRAFTGIEAENEAAKEQERRNSPSSASASVAEMHAR